jgi:hypothetical protein
MNDEVGNSVPRSSFQLHRLRRRLFTLLAAISLLLCLATIALWVRSRETGESFTRRSFSNATRTYRSFTVGWVSGDLYTAYTSSPVLPEVGPARLSKADGTWRHATFKPAPPSRGWYWYEGHDSAGTPGSLGPGHGFVTGLHLWAVAVLTLILPTLWIRSRRTVHKRQRLGLCLACGYDLRATPERCPECGMIPAAKANAGKITMKAER